MLPGQEKPVQHLWESGFGKASDRAKPKDPRPRVAIFMMDLKELSEAG